MARAGVVDRASIVLSRARQTEYRIWNPFRSKLGAAITNGIQDIFMGPGSKVLYLGAASGTTVSHVSDLVGREGTVYAVEFSHRSGRDLLGVAKKRTNIVPIVEVRTGAGLGDGALVTLPQDARLPAKYRMLVGMVDCIFSDVAQPDQARICILNAEAFLKTGGHLVISIKANCIDSTAAPEAVFAQEVQHLKKGGFKCLEQMTLEPFERDHAVVTAIFRAAVRRGGEGGVGLPQGSPQGSRAAVKEESQDGVKCNGPSGAPCRRPLSPMRARAPLSGGPRRPRAAPTRPAPASPKT